MDFVVTGINRMALDTNGMSLVGNAFSVGGSSFIVNAGSGSLAYQLTAGAVVAGPGSVAAPAFAFTGGANTGIFRQGAGMEFAVSGIDRMGLDGNGLAINANGSQATPSLYWGSSSAGTGLFAPAAGALGFTAAGVERMRLDPAGLVGIGTMTPSALLDVNGNAQFGSAGAKSTFTATGELDLANNAPLRLAGPNGFLFTGSSVVASSFYGDGSQLTNLPVSGGGVAKSGDSMTGQLTIGGSSLTVRSVSAVSPFLVSTSATAGNAVLYVDGLGNFGVGKTNPSYKLDVTGAGQHTRLLETNTVSAVTNLLPLTISASGGTGSNQGGKVGLILEHDPGAAGRHAKIYAVSEASNSNDIALTFETSQANTAATEKIRIAAGGNVGIGTTAPETLLDVNGAAQFGGTRKSTHTATGEIVSPSSITASAFYGYGGNLTGVTTVDGTRVAKAGDTMTGQLTVTGSSVNIVNTSVGSGGDLYSLAVTTAANRSVYHLVVSTYGNVGIGTAGPRAKLQINSEAGAAFSPVLSLRQGASPNYGFDFLQDDVLSGDLQLNRVMAGVSSQFMTVQRNTGKIGRAHV